MRRPNIVLMVLIIWPVFLAGCAQKTSRLEMNCGESFHLAKFNQILNADAGGNLNPVFGLDAQAALGTMSRYKKGFSGESDSASPSTVNINLGQ